MSVAADTTISTVIVVSLFWSVRQRRRLELLEQRQVECAVRPAIADANAADRQGWRRGVGTLRRRALHFAAQSSAVVPGPPGYTIHVEELVMLTAAPGPWTILELIGIDPKQILLLRGSDGHFHLRVEKRDVDRVHRELLGK